MIKRKTPRKAEISPFENFVLEMFSIRRFLMDLELSVISAATNNRISPATDESKEVLKSSIDHLYKYLDSFNKRKL